MKIIEQNLLTVSEGTILHQVNCKGAFGAGLAGQIARKWPYVKERYQDYVRGSNLVGDSLLETVLYVTVTPEDSKPCLWIANLFAQEGYGRIPGCRYTNYDALKKCMADVAKNVKVDWSYIQPPVYVPYYIGCGLAGGDWNVVRMIIEEELPEAIICRLPAAGEMRNLR